jgi:hypothetical protein
MNEQKNLIFHALKINTKFNIPSFFVDNIPVLKNLRDYKEGQSHSNVLKYEYNLDISIKAMKIYCEIKQCQVTKSLNEDIFNSTEEEPFTNKDWIYLLNLICWLGDFDLLDDSQGSLFNITRYIPNVEEVHEFIDIMEPDVFAKYSEDYIYEIFLHYKTDDFLLRYRSEPKEFKTWIKVVINFYYTPGSWYSTITRTKNILLDHIESDAETYYPSALSSLQTEDHLQQLVKWTTLSNIEKDAYVKLAFKEHINDLIKEGIKESFTEEDKNDLDLPKPNFRKDWMKFFTCLPELALTLWSTEEYKQQIINIIPIPNKKQKFVRNATYNEMIDFLSKDNSCVNNMSQRECELRANLKFAKNGQKLLERKGFYFPNDTEDVIHAKTLLNGYLKGKKTTKPTSSSSLKTTTIADHPSFSKKFNHFTFVSGKK